MRNHWLDAIKKRLDDEAAHPGLAFDRMKELGVIDDRGEVTGHVRQWDSFLAVTDVKFSSDKSRIVVFRCLKPVFGMPGEVTIDVSRDSMVDYLRQGRSVITATRDTRLGVWKQGATVYLSGKGLVISRGVADGTSDDLGPIPEFTQTTSRL